MEASHSFSWVFPSIFTALSLLCLVNSQQIPDRRSLINYELEQLLVDTGGTNGSLSLSEPLIERLILISVRPYLQICYYSLQQLLYGPWRTSAEQRFADLVSVDPSCLPYVLPLQVLYYSHHLLSKKSLELCSPFS